MKFDFFPSAVSWRGSIFLLASLGLVACNGTTNTTGSTTATAAATAAASGGQNKALLEALQATQDFTMTPVATLPTTGTATYNGYAQIYGDGTVVSVSELVGEAELEVAFSGTGGMTGTVSNFDDATGTYTGSLNVTGGTFSDGSDGRTITSSVAGTITRNTGVEIEVNGDISGRFTGSTGQHLVGFDDVTLTLDGNTATGNISLNASQP